MRVYILCLDVLHNTWKCWFIKHCYEPRWCFV